MSVDKLVDSTQLDSDLTLVANAIRTKGGTSAQLAFPAGFVQAIGDIETGGGGGSVTFEQILAVTHINDPIATSIDNLNLGTFINAVSAIFPNATGGSNYGAGYAIYRHPNLETLVLPKISQLSNSMINNCSKFKTLDLGPTFRIYYMQATQNDTVFDTIIIRSTSLPEMTNINALQNTPFASGKSGGTLYVPQSLIASYQAASNWSTILGYPNNQILPIEGSIYETQYADGTPITT